MIKTVLVATIVYPLTVLNLIRTIGLATVCDVKYLYKLKKPGSLWTLPKHPYHMHSIITGQCELVCLSGGHFADPAKSQM